MEGGLDEGQMLETRKGCMCIGEAVGSEKETVERESIKGIEIRILQQRAQGNKKNGRVSKRRWDVHTQQKSERKRDWTFQLPD